MHLLFIAHILNYIHVEHDVQVAARWYCNSEVSGHYVPKSTDQTLFLFTTTNVRDPIPQPSTQENHCLTARTPSKKSSTPFDSHETRKGHWQGSARSAVTCQQFNRGRRYPLTFFFHKNQIRSRGHRKTRRSLPRLLV